MALRDFDLARAEGITGYKFQDRTLLQQALQSPLKDRVAATGEVIEHDGNRRLAKLGFSVVDFMLVNEWFSQDLNHSALVLWLPLQWSWSFTREQSTSI